MTDRTNEQGDAINYLAHRIECAAKGGSHVLALKAALAVAELIDVSTVVKAVEVLSPQPGDVLLVTTKDRLAVEDAHRLAEQVEAVLNGVKVLVADNETTFTVARRDEDSAYGEGDGSGI